MWISIEQSVMISGIGHVFMGFVACDWSCIVEFTNYGGPIGALTSFGVSDLAENWVAQSVKSSLNQTTHSKVMIKNPNAPYMSIIG